jgi:hypothetical protein
MLWAWTRSSVAALMGDAAAMAVVWRLPLPHSTNGHRCRCRRCWRRTAATRGAAARHLRLHAPPPRLPAVRSQGPCPPPTPPSWWNWRSRWGSWRAAGGQRAGSGRAAGGQRAGSWPAGGWQVAAVTTSPPPRSYFVGEISQGQPSRPFCCAAAPGKLKPPRLHLITSSSLPLLPWLRVQLSEAVGRPAVLCAGWSDLDALVGEGEGRVHLPSSVLLVPSAPHDWLFPRWGGGAVGWGWERG